MSDISDIKQSLQRLTELSAGLRGQLERLRGSEKEEALKGLKAAGTRMGIGVGIAVLGLIILLVAVLYINALLIILFDLFLPLWAAALIIVLGGILLGAAVAAAGALVARKAVKDVPRSGGPVIEDLKATGQELKDALDELQARLKEQKQEQQKKAKEVAEKAKAGAPYVIAAYAGYRVIKGVARSRRRKRLYLEEA